MMSKEEREVALIQMQEASNQFYYTVIHIGVHPFIEFTGVMNEYIKLCQDAHAADIDFSECNVHTGQPLPIKSHQKDYINEKLECIFTGRSVVSNIKS
jgi:hypothetical protein